MVPVQMGDEHGVDVLKVGGRNTPLAVGQVGDIAAQKGIGEQAHAIYLDENGGVTDIGDGLIGTAV